MGVLMCIFAILCLIILTITLIMVCKIGCKYDDMRMEINKLYKTQEMQDYFLSGHNDMLKTFQKILKQLLLTERE